MNWNEHIELKRGLKSVATDQIKGTCQNFGGSPGSPRPFPCYGTDKHVFKVRITWSWRVLFLRLHLNSSDHKKPHPIIADLSSMFAQNFYNKIDFCSFVDFLYGHKNLQCKCKSDFFSSSVLVLTGTRLLVSAKEQKKQGSSEIANKQKRAGTERGEHLFKCINPLSTWSTSWKTISCIKMSKVRASKRVVYEDFTCSVC